MTAFLFFCALCALCGYPSVNAQQTPAGVEVDSRDSWLIREMESNLKSDPALGDALASRIARSSLAGIITKEQDPEKRLSAIRNWISDDPSQAALLGVGLTKDDAAGNTRYEDMLAYRGRRMIEENPDAKHGLFGRLKQSAKDSKLMKKDEQMANEEKQEIIKSLFEGKGGMSNKVLTQPEGGKDQPDKGAVGAGGLGGQGYFDRLGQENLHGYSPGLMAIQSALNQRRAPGAPRLIETGRLDYQTLSYPAYAMRYDVKNLEARLRYERNYALAKLLGEEKRYTPEELASENLGAQLEAKAQGKAAQNPRFERRLKALGRAKIALVDFDAEALKSRDPAKISRALLVALGGRQREATRWITVASLEEELTRLEAEENFLSPELLALVEKAPVPEARAAYRRQGEALKRKLEALKANDESAIVRLTADDWLARMAEAEGLLAKNQSLRKNLSRDIRSFASVPYRLQSPAEARPRWRELLDRLILRFLPNSDYARRLAQTRRDEGFFKDVFTKIAAGDLDAAAAQLAAHEPGRR